MHGELPGRMDKCVKNWFGDVERIDDERMTKRVHNLGVEGDVAEEDKLRFGRMK